MSRNPRAPGDVSSSPPYAGGVGLDQEGATVRWKRSLVTVFLAGSFTVFASAALDGEWPHHSAQWWLILITGILVITVITTVAELVYLAKKRDAGDASS